MRRRTLENSEDLSHNPPNNEVQQRRPQQAPKPGVKGRRQRAIRHQPPIRRRQPRRHTAHRAGQAAEDHRRTRVVQAHPARCVPIIGRSIAMKKP